MKSFLNRLFGSAPAAPSIQQQLAAAVNANDAATVAALLAQGAQPDVPDAPRPPNAPPPTAVGRFCSSCCSTAPMCSSAAPP